MLAEASSDSEYPSESEQERTSPTPRKAQIQTRSFDDDESGESDVENEFEMLTPIVRQQSLNREKESRETSPQDETSEVDDAPSGEVSAIIELSDDELAAARLA